MRRTDSSDGALFSRGALYLLSKRSRSRMYRYYVSAHLPNQGDRPVSLIATRLLVSAASILEPSQKYAQHRRASR